MLSDLVQIGRVHEGVKFAVGERFHFIAAKYTGENPDHSDGIERLSNRPNIGLSTKKIRGQIKAVDQGFQKSLLQIPALVEWNRKRSFLTANVRMKNHPMGSLAPVDIHHEPFVVLPQNTNDNIWLLRFRHRLIRVA